VKDHKKKDKWGQFPTRLVTPATNFTSAFPKLGYLGIKKIFNKGKVDCMKKMIIQASHAKGALENLNIKKSSHAIFSLDIKSFYLLPIGNMQPSQNCYQLLLKRSTNEGQTCDQRMPQADSTSGSIEVNPPKRCEDACNCSRTIGLDGSGRHKENP
jgi:hypothetical protein